jgi:membrane protease subunit (stomatin/prohibitin family)
MAIRDFFKKQFIDVIHWTEDDETTLACRFPMQDMEIQYGAQLTVRESQMAAFVNEGQVADVFGPGRFKLTTQTIPLLTNLRNWDKLFQSPFKSDVYFFSTRLKVDQKWGTPNAITIRDKEFGAVRLRAFGIYSYRIVDPKSFHVNVSGTRERYTVDDLSGQLRSTIVGAITDLFAESQVPFLDMAANQDEFAAQLRAKAADGFKALGLELTGFVVENLSLPEELQKILDQRIGMGMIGDMQRYTQFQVANSIPAAAANPGGLAGIGAGLATGVAMGQAMTQAIGQAVQPAAGAAPTAAAPAKPEDVTQLLEKLHDLKTKGVLTEDEFNAKKAELLKRLV